MRKMIFLLFWIGLLAPIAFGATTEVHVAGAAAYAVQRNVPWSNFAGANVEDFIFDKPSYSGNDCLYVINNNPTNSRTVTVGLAVTADLQVISFQGSNRTSWVLNQFAGGQAFTIPAASSQSIPISNSGFAHALVELSNESGTAGGSPDTATIILTFNNSCVRANSAAPSSFTPVTVAPPTQWAISSVSTAGNVATATQAAVSGVRHTAMCYSASIVSGSATGNLGAAFQIKDGTNVVWQVQIGSGGAAIGATANAQQCGLEIVGTSGNAMSCTFSGGSTSAIESCSLSGFDQ